MELNATTGLFVLGTDTAVGKTAVSSALLAAAVEVGVPVVPFKPFVSGADEDGRYEDIESLRRSCGLTLSDAQISPCRLSAPMAPAMAAEQACVKIDWNGMTQRWNQLREEGLPVLVEGAGGLMVPLDPDDSELTMLSLAGAFKLPVLLVARATLGTINHTMLSVMALRAAGVTVLGVVTNQTAGAEEDVSVAHNKSWLEKMTGLEVLAELNHVEGYCPAQDAPPREHVAALAHLVPMLLGSG